MAYRVMETSHNEIIAFVRSLYSKEGRVPLHEPRFQGNEKKYILDAIDSTYVSSVGPYVDRFEEMIRDYTESKFAVSVVNGTSALHVALMLAGVARGDLVLTQAFTFVATVNPIAYIGAEPVFIDIDRETLGMSPDCLEDFFKAHIKVIGNEARHITSGRRISACVPMHSFGIPCQIDRIVEICNSFHVKVVEDSAESLGSIYKSKHTGTYGTLGVYSLNGNKTITSGGGGVIVTDDEKLGKLAKHITTQAKIPHQWEFKHDMLGYNLRCPNLNAALACAQLEQLEEFISVKRDIAKSYQKFFQAHGIDYISESSSSRSNYWLNSMILKSKADRDSFLELSNSEEVMTRPAWTLINELPMYDDCIHDGLINSIDIQNKLVSIPSGVK